MMKSKSITILYCLFFTGLFNSLALAQPIKQQSLEQLVEDIAVPFIAKNQIPGVAIAIYYNGQDYYFNYGLADKKRKIPVTKDTIFELASITKIFVSTLLAVEVQAGKMSLSDPVVKYTPKLANTKGLPIDRVKVFNLATHTASFPRQMQQFGVEKGDSTGLFDRLKKWQPRVRIGTEYKYSNIGFGFLGMVLEGATGDSLTELLNQIITVPLGMTNTYFEIPKAKTSFEAQGYRPNNQSAPYYVPANFLGGGALRSSAADLLKFMKANLGIRVGDASPQLLSAMHFAQQPYFQVKPDFIMGLGWQRVKRLNNVFITKNGGNEGFNTFIGFSPAKQFGVVVLTNQAKGKATLLGNKILNGLLFFLMSAR